MRRLSLFALVVLASCSGDDGHVAADAGGAVRYLASIDPERDVPFTLTGRIDGTPGTQLERRFDDEASFDDARITFELLDGDTVVDSLTLSPADELLSCARVDGASTVEHQVCGFANGELRAGLARNVNGCIPHAACAPRCEVREDRCGAGTRCGLSFATTALTYARAGCVPAGPRTHLESCTYTAGADGRYHDDCGAGHACVDSLCRPLCGNDTCQAPDTCVRLAAYPPEVTVCLPPPS